MSICKVGQRPFPVSIVNGLRRLSHLSGVLLLLCFLTLHASLSWAVHGLDQLPEFDDLDISSDGNHMLMVRSGGEYYDLVVKNLNSGSERTLFKGGERGLINWCRWGNDERIVCSLRFYIPAPQLGHVTRTRLMAINIDGSQQIMLIPKAKNRERWPQVWDAQVQDKVVSWLVQDKAHILVQLNRDAANRPSVYKLNIYTNRMARVQRPRGMVRRWYATHEGNVRLAIGYRNDREPVVYYVNGRVLREYTAPAYDSEIPPQPLGFSADEKEVYLSMTNGQDRHGIYRVDLKTGEVLGEVYRDPHFDVFGGIIMHPDSGEPVGVSYLRHHPEIVFFDERLKQLFKAIAQRLPGEQFGLISSDQGYRKFVLYSYGGISPRYYLAQVDDKVRVREIGRDFPALSDPDIVDLEPVAYDTQDGLSIPAYLAEPEGKGPFPTVLLPHGGPYSRDSAEFDPWTQYLVNHGFAVLKPNYRGSVGYGEAYMQAGYKQWGLKMQQDLMDGLDWLVDKGIADPERVCVVGASFGGYTALISAYKYAEKISCAVSMAGISDLEKMVDRMYSFDLAARNRERLQESRDLRANSPIRQAQRFAVPVLMLHGNQDTVVRVKQSREMAAALSRHDKEHRYVEQQGDHFLSTSSQLSEFFSEMEDWLKAHTAL